MIIGIQLFYTVAFLAYYDKFLYKLDATDESRIKFLKAIITYILISIISALLGIIIWR